MVKYVIKRDGRLVDFNNQKIVAAILKAMNVTKTAKTLSLPQRLLMPSPRRTPKRWVSRKFRTA